MSIFIILLCIFNAIAAHHIYKQVLINKVNQERIMKHFGIDIKEEDDE